MNSKSKVVYQTPGKEASSDHSASDKQSYHLELETIDSFAFLEIVDQIPIGIVEENYTQPKKLIDSLGFETGDQLSDYFLKNPKILIDIVGSINITKINPTALKIYDAHSPEEFINDQNNTSRWIDQNWVRFYITELAALFNNNLPFNREYTDTTVSGKPVDIRNVTRIVLGSEHSWERIIRVVEDITERKKIKIQLQHAQKMGAVGRLTSELAHDINNVLAVISGNLESLQQQLPGKNPNIKEMFDAIYSGSSLVKQLLLFSKKQQLNPELIQVGTVITELAGIMKRVLGKSIDINLKIPKALWYVEADNSRLENALLNLALNARDAMPYGGVLKLNATNEVLSHAMTIHNQEISPGEYIVISVIDSGKGMSDEVLLQTLDAFLTTQDIGMDSSLGLSSVYDFVNEIGGHLAITSTEDTGTHIQLYLPRAEKRQYTATENAIEVADTPIDEIILILEDEIILSNLVTKMLKDLGYKVLIALNGLEALNILTESKKVDLFLCDIGLPGELNGIAVAQKALTLQPGLKVQLMSGYVDEKNINYVLAEQFGTVLDKPFRKSDLAKRLRTVLDAADA